MFDAAFFPGPEDGSAPFTPLIDLTFSIGLGYSGGISNPPGPGSNDTLTFSNAPSPGTDSLFVNADTFSGGGLSGDAVTVATNPATLTSFSIALSDAGFGTAFGNGTFGNLFLLGGLANVFFDDGDEGAEVWIDILRGTDAGSGSVSLQDNAVVPLPAALPLFSSGLALLGLLGWGRRLSA